jgi:hypothetical protein
MMKKHEEGWEGEERVRVRERDRDRDGERERETEQNTALRRHLSVKEGEAVR